MAMILKHKKTLEIQSQTVCHFEQVQTALIKYNKENMYKIMYVGKLDKCNTLLTEVNGRKNPFNTSEVKYFEVRVFIYLLV